MAEHLDHLHYLNDILCLNITDLNEVLTEHLLHKLLIPLYIYSLRSIRKQSETNIETVTHNLAKVLNRNLNLGESSLQLELNQSNNKVSCIVALFLLSQVFLIISHPPLIHTLAWIILKTDKKMHEEGMDKLLEHYDKEVKESKEISNVNIKSTEECSSNYNASCTTDVVDHKNITDEEKQRLATIPTDISFLKNTPFLETIFNAVDCGENDYTALFALCLLYALVNNKGIMHNTYYHKIKKKYNSFFIAGVVPDILEGVLRPRKTLVASSTTKDIRYSYNFHLIDRLMHIVTLSCQPSCAVRLVTLELVLKLLGQLVICDGKNILSDPHKLSIESVKMQSTALLRNFYKSEEIFLDMFEHE